MCVVLGVGVISVFDAVAFLACAHRVSSPELRNIVERFVELPHDAKRLRGPLLEFVAA